LGTAIGEHGAPEMLNTDQGSQFTSIGFTEYVTKEKAIRLSMDGKGRALDNIFVERLRRSVKYEHVYLFPAEDGLQCYRGLEEYFEYYDHERRHQSLDDETPSTIYGQSKGKVA
jgi:putative transposase